MGRDRLAASAAADFRSVGGLAFAFGVVCGLIRTAGAPNSPLRALSGRHCAAFEHDEAIRYTLTRWDGLSRFLDDGHIDLDNNIVERSIRPLALNRKNALFAGSDEGGDNWAVIATLIECCKLNAINPHEWLTEALTKLANGHHANRVGELMPWTSVG